MLQEKVVMPAGKDRQDKYTATGNVKPTQRKKRFSTQIGNVYTYRTPLRVFPNVGKVNQSIEIDLKIMCRLERSMVKGTLMQI